MNAFGDFFQSSYAMVLDLANLMGIVIRRLKGFLMSKGVLCKILHFYEILRSNPKSSHQEAWMRPPNGAYSPEPEQ